MISKKLLSDERHVCMETELSFSKITFKRPFLGKPAFLTSFHHYWNSFVDITVPKPFFVHQTRNSWYIVFYGRKTFFNRGFSGVLILTASVNFFGTVNNHLIFNISDFQDYKFIITVFNICEVDMSILYVVFDGRINMANKNIDGK